MFVFHQHPWGAGVCRALLVAAALCVLLLGVGLAPASEPLPAPRYTRLASAPSGTAECLAALRLALQEDNRPLRNEMFRRLLARPSEALPGLLELSGDPQAELAGYAAFALGWIGEAAATTRLVELCRDERLPVARAAAKALGSQLGRQLGRQLGTPAAAGQQPALAALTALIEHRDPQVRRDAVYALGLSRLPEARLAVEPLLTHPDEATRMLAQQALNRIAADW